MPHERMTQCEQKKQLMLTDKREWRWIKVPVYLVGTSYVAIRCMHCHGAVRIHKQKANDGPKDHVEHRSRQDSERCRSGIHFQGEHRLSLQPVQ